MAFICTNYHYFQKALQMKKLKIGINGLGRIGRSLIREYFKRPEDFNFEIHAVNNPGELDSYMHLLKYDSVHRDLNGKLEYSENSFSINNHKINFYSERDPSKIPWENDLNIVVDSTGVFRDHKSLSAHIRGNIKKVILCAPGKEMDGTFVFGINHKDFDSEKHHIVSNASCTTNCLSPLVKIVNDHIGIEEAFMTTIHAYTNDQNLLDNSHKDLRRARAAALSMIPTTTGAAVATTQVIPELKGKLNGYAIRVPTADVSLVDLTVFLKKETTKETVNDLFHKMSQTEYKGVLGFTTEPLVSIDLTGRPESSIIDAGLTMINGKTLKLVSWYDNEIGFSNRVLDLANYIGDKTWA